MTTDTLLAISAGATFLLALAAFWAIWQNYSFRKEDRDLHTKVNILDQTTEWARKARETIFTSLSEYGKYEVDLKSSLETELANLEAQVRTREAQVKTTEEVELANLKKELRGLEKELGELRARRPTKDDINFKVLSVLTEAVAEYDLLIHRAPVFGKTFQVSLERAGEILRKIIESLDCGTYPDRESLKKCLAILGQLFSDAVSLKSLLLRHGSKLKL